jgi:hypothetical protein
MPRYTKAAEALRTYSASIRMGSARHNSRAA